MKIDRSKIFSDEKTERFSNKEGFTGRKVILPNIDSEYDNVKEMIKNIFGDTLDFNNINESEYPIPKQIMFGSLSSVVDRDVYVIKYKDYYVEKYGIFSDLKELKVVKTYDFDKVMKHLITVDSLMLATILEFYKELASNIECDIDREIHERKLNDKDLFEVVDRLELFHCLDFLTKFESKDRDFYHIKDFFKNAFTAYIIRLEFFRKYYNKDFNPSKYIAPFKLLIDNCGLNEDMIEKYTNYNLFTERLEDFNSINLCYDLTQNNFSIRTFNPELGKVWMRPLPAFEPANKFYTIGFLSSKFILEEFSKGDYSFMNVIGRMIKNLAVLAYSLDSDLDNNDLRILSELDRGFEEKEFDDDYDDEISSKDKDLLIKFQKYYLDINHKHHIKEIIPKELFKEFVDTLRNIIKNNKYVINALNSEESIVKNKENRDLIRFIQIVKTIM